MKQKEQLAAQEQKLEELTLKIEDVETLLDDVSDAAYDKAVEVVTDTVRQETHKEDIRLVEETKKWVPPLRLVIGMAQRLLEKLFGTDHAACVVFQKALYLPGLRVLRHEVLLHFHKLPLDGLYRPDGSLQVFRGSLPDFVAGVAVRPVSLWR